MQHVKKQGIVIHTQEEKWSRELSLEWAQMLYLDRLQSGLCLNYG